MIPFHSSVTKHLHDGKEHLQDLEHGSICYKNIQLATIYIFFPFFFLDNGNSFSRGTPSTVFGVEAQVPNHQENKLLSLQFVRKNTK